MFSKSADTFRSRARLAICLSWVAGFTNVVMLTACGETVCHQTGNVTHLGLAVGGLVDGKRSLSSAGLFMLIIGCFLIGAMLSGFITEWTRRHEGRARYVVPMIIEGILLGAVMIELLLSPHGGWIAMPLAALAMGLQNATITKISGAVVRTTHLTGVITDFGLESVALLMWWRDRLRNLRPRRIARSVRIMRRQTHAQRVAVLGSIFGSFLFGAVLGAMLFAKFGAMILLAPVLFLLMLILTSRAASTV